MLRVVVANCLAEDMAKSILKTIVIAAKPMKEMTGMGPDCVKTLGAIRLVRKRPEFRAPARNLG